MTASLPMPVKFATWAWVNVRNRYRIFRAGLARAGVYSFATVHLYGGFAGIAYGCWLWHRPLGWIVGGLLAVYMARLWGDETLDRR